MIAGHLQEKHGIYYIVLSYKDSAGKRHTPWFSTDLPVRNNKKRAMHAFFIAKENHLRR